MHSGNFDYHAIQAASEYCACYFVFLGFSCEPVPIKGHVKRQYFWEGLGGIVRVLILQREKISHRCETV